MAIRQYNLFSAWFDGEEVVTDEQDLIADAIKEEIWANPILYYSAETLEPMGLGEDFAIGDDDDDEGEEFDDEGEEGVEEGEEGDEEIEA